MEEILHQLRLVVCPIIYKVLYIPGCAGFLPSTVPNSKILKNISFLLSTDEWLQPKWLRYNLTRCYLAKLQYFTNLDITEIRGFPLLNHQTFPNFSAAFTSLGSFAETLETLQMAPLECSESTNGTKERLLGTEPR